MAGNNFFASGSDNFPARQSRQTSREDNSASGPGPGADDTAGPARAAAAAPGEGTGPRRRGRPPGSGGKDRTGSKSGSKKNNANLAASLDQLSNMIMFSSGALAIVTAPEIAFDKDEADATTKAVANLYEVYNVEPDPVREAWAGMIFTVVPIFAKKGFMIKNRRKRERAERTTQVPGTPAPEKAEMKMARTTNGSGAEKSSEPERVDMTFHPLGSGGPEGRG